MTFRSIALLVSLSLTLLSPAAFAAQPTKHHALRVQSYRVERDVRPGRNKVVGTLVNTGHTRVHVAKVRFRLYDAKGRAIGQASDEVRDLNPGRTWKFHASARGNVSRARLLQVQAR